MRSKIGLAVAAGILGLLIAIKFQPTLFHAAEIPLEKKSTEYRFVKINCWFEADWQATITCGELHTPESHGAFTLPVVILHSDHSGAQPDPVVYLQGGPGASAGLHADGIKRWLNWMRLANIKRDLILTDPRGTGRSRPALVCAEYNRANQQLFKQNKSLGEELAESFSVTSQCFSDAGKNNPALDYRHFGTQLSAQDIRALMAELDYAQWNIIGVSYGTRLALEIARQEQFLPQTVKLKSMVLDSIYPAGFGGVQTWPQVLDDAVQSFLKGCAEQNECAKSRGIAKEELQISLVNALQRLRQEPMLITIKHWDGEAPMQWLVNDHRFVSLVFSGIYDSLDWPKIMDAIRGVNDGRSDMLKPLAEPYLNNSVSADFNSLTFTAVDCADNPVMPEADYRASVNKYPLLEDYTRDQWRYQLCHELRSVAPLQLAEPLVPTLILAGAKDPITPVSWAKEIHRQWPQTQLRINEDLAHSVLGSDVCVLENLASFFDRPETPFVACEELAQTATP
jgi:pimeloyl-ACP methyl ester carboxylesterase